MLYNVLYGVQGTEARTKIFNNENFLEGERTLAGHQTSSHLSALESPAARSAEADGRDTQVS